MPTVEIPIGRETENETVIRQSPKYAPPAPARPSNTLFIIGIVAASLLVLGAFAGFFIYQYGPTLGGTGNGSNENTRSTDSNSGSVPGGGDSGSTSTNANQVIAPSIRDREPMTGKVGITMENYFRLQNGMQYEEVVDILGGPGKKTSEKILPFGNIPLTSYEWRKENAVILASFEGGKLITRAHGGLDRKATPELDKKKFERLKVGDTYENAVTTLGGEGIESMASHTGLKIYQWNGTDGVVYRASFRNGGLIDKAIGREELKTQ